MSFSQPGWLFGHNLSRETSTRTPAVLDVLPATPGRSPAGPEGTGGGGGGALSLGKLCGRTPFPDGRAPGRNCALCLQHGDRDFRRAGWQGEPEPTG